MAMPLWDYNLSLGNANYNGGESTAGWYYNVLSANQYPWYGRLFQDPEFVIQYWDRWHELRGGILETRNMLERIRSYEREIARPALRNFNKWRVLGVYLWPSAYVALAFAVPSALLGSMWLGPTFAIAQGLAKPHMRALVSAILLFIINLIGLGLGPYAVGELSDTLAPEYGVESIRYALLSVVLIGNAWSALHYALGARTLREDLLRKDAAG